MSKDSDSIVSLNIQTPKYVYPPVLDAGLPTLTRAHDPFADNGILLPGVSGETPISSTPSVVLCFNDVQDYSVPAVKKRSDDKSLLLSSFFDDGSTKCLPKRTNVACWWCCHRFDTPPIGAPFEYKHVEDVFGGCGCFCSFPCALAWLQDHKACHKYIPLLRFMRQKQTDVLLGDDIRVAPPREMLSMFGGSLSIEEFRADNCDYSGLRMVHVPNMYPIEMRAEDRNRTMIESSSVLQFLKLKRTCK